MTKCIDEQVSVATIYSPAKKRSLPHIVRWQNKSMRVKETGLRQFLDGEALIEAHDVVADSGLQLTLLFNTTTRDWSVESISQY